MISSANGGILQASDKTRVSRPRLPLEAGNGIIAPGIQHLLTGGTSFADQGLIRIFHPHFEGVTMHQRKDVDNKYTGEPVMTGYCERTGHYFWRVPIKAPKSATQTSKKLSIVECLMLSKSPTILSDVLAQATEVTHNVYKLLSIEKGIQWMYTACGYPVQSTWIKAIRKGNYANWPLLTVENVNKHYPETDETPMGHLNQTQVNIRFTKPKRASLPEATEEELAQLRGKKEQNVYISVIDTWTMKNTVCSDQTGQFLT